MTTWAAQLFAKREGFGIAGAVPTRNNNPGDLRHAPGAHHEPGDPDGIGSFTTPEEGWQMLDRQLGLYAERGLTLQAAAYKFAPPSENNSAAYLQFLVQNLPGSNTMPMSEVINVPAPGSNPPDDFDRTPSVY